MLRKAYLPWSLKPLVVRGLWSTLILLCCRAQYFIFACLFFVNPCATFYLVMSQSIVGEDRISFKIGTQPHLICTFGSCLFTIWKLLPMSKICKKNLKIIQWSNSSQFFVKFLKSQFWAVYRVEISGFFCHSDLTLNQLWRI